MSALNYVLIDESHRFKLLASYLDTYKLHNVLVLFGTSPQIEFFTSVITNINPKLNLNFGLIHQPQDLENYQHVVLMDVPTTFELLTPIIQKLNSKSKLVLFLFKSNKSYVKLLHKKLSLQFKELTFNPHKFLIVEDKFMEMVDSNYAINRQAFYAYGSFLQYFNKNLLKRIFRTDRLNVKAVGLGFGMPVPPKVNLEAKFLTQKAQSREKTIKRKQKIARMRERAALTQAQLQQNQPQKQQKQVNDIVKKVPKTKKIEKSKRVKSNI